MNINKASIKTVHTANFHRLNSMAPYSMSQHRTWSDKRQPFLLQIIISLERKNESSKKMFIKRVNFANVWRSTAYWRNKVSRPINHCSRRGREDGWRWQHGWSRITMFHRTYFHTTQTRTTTCERIINDTKETTQQYIKSIILTTQKQRNKITLFNRCSCNPIAMLMKSLKIWLYRNIGLSNSTQRTYMRPTRGERKSL